MLNYKSIKNFGFGVFNKITIEPIIISWLLSYLLASSNRYEITSEKVCRELVNSSKGFDRDICKIVIFDIFDYDDCELINTHEEEENLAESYFDEIKTIEDRFPSLYKSINKSIDDAISHVCEIKNNPTYLDRIYDYDLHGNLFFDIVPIIILLFVGPWSDQQNLRLPCLLIPLMGQVICHIGKNDELILLFYKMMFLIIFALVVQKIFQFTYHYLNISKREKAAGSKLVLS